MDGEERACMCDMEGPMVGDHELEHVSNKAQWGVFNVSCLQPLLPMF